MFELWPRKYKYTAVWNNNDKSGFENLIQYRDRYIEENTKENKNRIGKQYLNYKTQDEVLQAEWIKQKVEYWNSK